MPKFLLKKSSVSLIIVAVFGVTYVAASGATGHLFHSDPPRHSHENVQTVKIDPSGGSGPDSMDIAFHNLLPGSPQTVSVNYRNTGNVAESVWVRFPNSTALSALNTLGRYGSIHLSSTGGGSIGDVFDSTDLNDNTQTCGVFSKTGCWPLQQRYLIADSLAPGQSGSFSISFEFASAYSAQPTSNATAGWNPYPTAGQTTVNKSDGTGTGLPYEIVAVLPGYIPGQPYTIIQRDPFGDTVTTARSGREFSDHLKVEGAQEPLTFTVSDPNPHLTVSSEGVVSTVGGPLAAGSYTIAGTDADNAGNFGTWTYTLVVTTAKNESSNH